MEHLDPTTEITLDAVKKRAVRGVVVLTGRHFFLKAVSFIAFFFVTIFLDESQYGVFILVSAVLAFLSYFSDIGLAAALIQKKDKVTERDLKTTFTVQQVLVISLLLILYFLSPYIRNFYSLSEEGLYLLYALGFSFFLSSLKTIPSVLMERELDFARFVIPEILETLVFNVSLVFLAWRGFGITSYTYAVLARGVVGLVVIYTLKPWLPGLAFSRKSLEKLLSFGLPYQVNTFLAVLKDDGITLALGGILGTSGIGLLGWAQKWAQYPLRLFMDNVTRVTFPAFSRMQDEREHLSRSLTRSIFFICFLVFPSIVALLILAPTLIEIVPSYEKWRPALVPLFLLSVNALFAASTTQMTNLLNAVGKIKTTFKLMIMWTALSWLLVPTLGSRVGVNGAALGYALVSVSSVIAMYIVYRIVKYSVTEAIVKPALASILMAFVMLLVNSLLPGNLLGVITNVMIGASAYFSFSYLIVGKSILDDVRKTFLTLFPRS